MNTAVDSDSEDAVGCVVFYDLFSFDYWAQLYLIKVGNLGLLGIKGVLTNEMKVCRQYGLLVEDRSSAVTLIFVGVWWECPSMDRDRLLITFNIGIA